MLSLLDLISLFIGLVRAQIPLFRESSSLVYLATGLNMLYGTRFQKEYTRDDKICARVLHDILSKHYYNVRHSHSDIELMPRTIATHSLNFPSLWPSPPPTQPPPHLPTLLLSLSAPVMCIIIIIIFIIIILQRTLHTTHIISIIIESKNVSVAQNNNNNNNNKKKIAE